MDMQAMRAGPGRRGWKWLAAPSYHTALRTSFHRLFARRMLAGLIAGESMSQETWLRCVASHHYHSTRTWV